MVGAGGGGGGGGGVLHTMSVSLILLFYILLNSFGHVRMLWIKENSLC